MKPHPSRRRDGSPQLARLGRAKCAEEERKGGEGGRRLIKDYLAAAKMICQGLVLGEGEGLGCVGVRVRLPLLR
jgi:hypothetical protein